MTNEKLIRYLRHDNPQITQEQAAFMAEHLTPWDLVLLKNELDHRKLDHLKLCIAMSNVYDVDDIEPSCVMWYGIPLHNISLVFMGNLPSL